MNLRDEQKKVQQAMNAALSGLQEDPWLTGRVLANAKGEEKVKKKRISALALVVILIIALIGTACAVFSSRIGEFFSRTWNREMGERIGEGKIAQIGESVTVGDVVFTLEEIAYRDRALYGIGTVRAVDEKDVLVPYDIANEPEYFVSSEEGKAYIAKAKETGGRLLTAEAIPMSIGVDEGPMLTPGSIGYYDEDNGDGTLTFSFEASDGFAVNEGTSYQIGMMSSVDVIDGNGQTAEGTYRSESWTVSCVPAVISETAEPRQPAEEISVEGLEGYEVAAPAAYLETGTLPVYRAEETDIAALTDPAWFNTTGIREQGEDYMVFNDHAQLQVSEEGLWYAEYGETEGQRTDSEMIFSLVWIKDWHGHIGEFTLERKELSGITLDEARRKAEELFARLGLDREQYTCTYALDMSLERIRTMGAIWEDAVARGDHYDGEDHKPYDYDAIPASEEGYYLEYRPLETDTENCSGHFGAQLYINSRGIVYASVRNEYSRGEASFTPEKLITAEDAVKRLAEEIALSRSDAESGIGSVRKVALSYAVIRAGNKADGMAFVPAWAVLYLEPGMEADEPDSCYALFNAVDGSLIDATFQ